MHPIQRTWRPTDRSVQGQGLDVRERETTPVWPRSLAQGKISAPVAQIRSQGRCLELAMCSVAGEVPAARYVWGGEVDLGRLGLKAECPFQELLACMQYGRTAWVLDHADRSHRSWFPLALCSHKASGFHHLPPSGPITTDQA
ncbi:5-hydroxytryptamine receptor 5A-like [Platysternon megacephalum]|uniref:5-hydroxytryptamine receptor 5A-like n=1 Tax=Platysternon megacephalum TaxID=55544 RepID=A0A4D9EHR1_9SAUR|nr:5-hydroxytryptamine receptor 5A-like [Platysternon megacephalum]